MSSPKKRKDDLCETFISLHMNWIFRLTFLTFLESQQLYKALILSSHALAFLVAYNISIVFIYEILVVMFPKHFRLKI